MNKIFDQMIQRQRIRLLDIATKIVPHLTSDDILQPCDFPELENCGFFRYEEGVLEGLLSAKAAYLLWAQENSNSSNERV